ncbi:MAG: ABC transporter ATP-binding protein [Candidatus Rokubacteria bacterium]|nr:ABC transporter ATP-binding protein [Candidatus Rokubacteria bacterium]
MAEARRLVGSSIATVASLFRGLPRAWALAAAVVLMGAVTTLFEGAGILLILPFLQKLISGPGAALSVSIPQLPGIDAWLGRLPAGWQLPAIAALILAAVLFREAVAYANGILKNHLSMRVANVHRAALHEALIHARPIVSARYPHGYAQQLLHVEANRLASLVLQTLSLVELGVIMVTVWAIMLSISPALTALVVALLVVGGLPLTGFFKWIKHSSLGRMVTRATLNEYLSQLMPFLPSVHVFGGQGRERAAFASRYGEMFERDMRLQRMAGLIGPIYHLVGVVGVLGTALLAVALHRDDVHAVGWVIPFIVLFSRLLPVMNGMNHAFGTIGDGLEAYRKFAGEIEFLRAQRLPDGTRPFPARFEALEVRGVSFGYDDTPVVRDLSLSVRRGRHVALTGPSGSGKSTLCLLIARLHDPARGEVRIDGVPLTEFRLDDLRRAISVVEQSPVLLNDTVRANITYGRDDATAADVRRAALAANADEFIAGLPEGYETNVGNLGTAISGGQRQRIALARALLRRPQILILDEATSAVDARSESLIKEAIERLRGETTVISVAHRLSTIKDADEIHFVRDGRIVASGTFAELAARSDEFRAYVKAQELTAEAVAGEITR